MSRLTSPWLFYGTHFVCYQSVWFIAVLGAQQGSSTLGLWASLLITGVQLFWQARHDRIHQGLITFTSLVLLSGLLVDSTLLKIGLMQISANPWQTLSPPWMWGLWLNFAVNCHCLLQAYLQRYWIMSAAAGAGFALAFAAGQSLGAAAFSHPVWGPVTLGLVWAIAWPVVLMLYQYLIIKIQVC
jgi:hypothetical protein